MSVILRCPICGNPLPYGSCPSCGLNLLTGDVPDFAPDWFRESFEVLQMIRCDKPMFVFAPVQLFDPLFTADSIIVITGKSGNTAAEVPSNFDSRYYELIAYGDIPAVIYKEVLHEFVNPTAYGLVRPGIPVVRTLANMSDGDMLRYSAYHLLDQQYQDDIRSYTAMSALTAFTAPTWIDAALALTDQSAMDFYAKSASEILYSYTICDKSPVLNVSSIKDALKSFVDEQTDYVLPENFRDIAPEHLSCAKDMIQGVPELWVNNLGEFIENDYNMYLFALHKCMVNIDAVSEQHAVYTETARFLNKLWQNYGVSQSEAVKALKKYPGTKREAYVAFWRDIKARLHK